MTSIPALVVTDGLFGEQVGEALRELLALTGRPALVVPEPPGEQLDGLLAASAVCVRASWRDVDTEFGGYAEAAERAGRPFLPVAFADPQIRVGPLVLPGEAPCHGCFAVRVRQHADGEDPLAEQVAGALRGTPGLGVTGYPPHLTMLAAALVLDLLGEDWGGSGVQLPARVTLINVDSDQVRSWAVSTTALCPACSPATERAALRKVRHDRLRALATAPSGAPDGPR